MVKIKKTKDKMNVAELMKFKQQACSIIEDAQKGLKKMLNTAKVNHNSLKNLQDAETTQALEEYGVDDILKKAQDAMQDLTDKVADMKKAKAVHRACGWIIL